MPIITDKEIAKIELELKLLQKGEVPKPTPTYLRMALTKRGTDVRFASDPAVIISCYEDFVGQLKKEITRLRIIARE